MIGALNVDAVGAVLAAFRPATATDDVWPLMFKLSARSAAA